MRPLTPPAAFMSSIASSPALRIADPGSAYGPVNGPVIPTLITPPPPAVLELPHAPITHKASAARLVTRSRRFNIDNLPFVSAARAACVMRRLGPPPSSRLPFGARVRRRQATTPSTGAQYQIGLCDCQGELRTMSRLWLQE